MTFGSASSWSFDNDIARNLQQFLVLTIVHHFVLTVARIIFLVLGEGPTFGTNGKFGSLEKNSSNHFSKANTNFV